jgi:streptogramin lyase
MVFGLPSLSFTATGLVARLIPVSGNNQSGEPGEELPEPLVVRLEDQFGNPVEGASIQAQIIEGLGVLRPIPFPGRCATPGSEDPGTAVESVTNTQGEVAFCLQVDAREDSLILVEVNAPDIPQTEPLRLVTLVGFVIPLDIAVAADGSLLVVDAGLQAVLRVDPVTGERVLVSGVDIDTDPDTEDPVIGRGPTLVFPRGLVASAHGPLLVLDAGGSGFEAIMQVDPVSGDRTLLSGRGQGSGPALQSPTDINLAPDGTPVVVGQSDAGGMAVLRVDPRTGDRTILSGGIDLHSGQPIGAGPPFRVPQSITVTDNSLFVVEAGSNYQAVIRVDPENGDRQVVSGIDPDTGQTLGHGPPFLNPAGIAVQTDGNPVVTDTLHDSIIEVTLSQDGRRQILSGKDPDTELPIGSGPSLTIPQGIAVESDGNLVLVDRGLAAVVRVAPRTRNRMIVSQTRVGHGQPFASPRSVAVESEQTLVVVDNSLDAVLRVDLATGNRMIVSNATTGRGPPLEFPVALAVEADGSLVVVDSAVLDGSAGLRAIVRINPRNGNRDIVSGPTCGGEPGLQFPSGIAIETDGSLVVAEGLIGLNAVVRVDRNSGHCDIVSGGPDDLGERPFSGPRDITVAPDGTLFVIDSEGVVQVDPRTGERRGVSDLAPGFVPSAVAVEADGQHLVVINSSKEEVERINLVNGSRDLVSGQDRGRGVLFFDPQDIVVQPDGTLIVMEGAFGLKAVVQVDSVSGDRTLLAK